MLLTDVNVDLPTTAPGRSNPVGGDNAREVTGVPAIWEAGAMVAPPVVPAHQGGWDEALLLLTPVALLVGLVWAATVRARGQNDADGTGGADRR